MGEYLIAIKATSTNYFATKKNRRFFYWVDFQEFSVLITCRIPLNKGIEPNQVAFFGSIQKFTNYISSI